MSDTKTGPYPASINPSFSVEIPTPKSTDPADAALPAPQTSYWRVGNPDPTSDREAKYFGAAFAKQKPGMLMLTSGDTTFVTSATTTLKDAAESLAVSRVDGNIVSSTYSYQEGAIFRDVSFKLSHASSWSVSDSQSWKVGANTDVGISNDQKVSIGTGLSVKMSSDSTVPLGLMSVTSDKSGMEVKSEFGNFKLNNNGKLSGAETISISISPLTFAYLKQVESANYAMVVLTGLIAGIAAARVTGTGAVGVSQKGGAPKGAFDYDFETAVKSWSQSYAGAGLAELGVLTVMQAAFIPLGIIGITAGKAADKGIFPKIAMDLTSITLSVGTTILKLDALGLHANSGPMTYIELSPTGAEMFSISNRIANSVSNLTVGPTINARSPAITMRGSATVSISAPAVAFGP